MADDIHKSAFAVAESEPIPRLKLRHFELWKRTHVRQFFAVKVTYAW